MGEFRAVLFDFDDTVADTFPARIKSLSHVFATAQVWSPTADEFFRALGGNRFDHALANLEVDLRLRVGLFELFREHYWQKPPGLIRLYPGVGPMLDRLLEARVKLAIVTSKFRQRSMGSRVGGALSEMRELQIVDFFPVVVGLEDVTNAKPDPEGLLLALDRLDVSASQALYVGDAPADIAAASAAGIRSCWAAWGSQLTDMISPQPDFIANRPAEIIDLWRSSC